MPELIGSHAHSYPLFFFVRGLPDVYPILVAYRACAEVKRYVPVTVGALSLEKVTRLECKTNVYRLNATLAFAKDVANALFKEVETNDSD